MPNQGEAGELLLKASIILAMYSGKAAGPLGKVTEAHVGDLESNRGIYQYPLVSIPDGVCEVCEDSAISDYGQIRDKLWLSDITKASNSLKADIRVNGIYYSVKSADEKPAVVNHTKRSGFLKAAETARCSIEILDQNIQRYWELRLSGLIGEDVGMITRKCLNLFWDSDFKEEFRPVFNYFAFWGTGRGPSKIPAGSILEYKDPRLTDTWTIYTKDSFFEACWPSLIFSLRAKGDPEFNFEDQKWVRHSNGKPRGQLHIRIG